jgi:hypothetical protein
MRGDNRPQSLLLILALGASLSACFRAHAKTAPNLPPLEIPAPPPRQVEANEAEVPPPVPLPEEPARRVPPARPRPTPAQTAGPRTEPKQEAAKPDAPALESKPAEEGARPPVTTLQTTPPGSEGKVEGEILAELAKATSDLNRIDYRALNPDARTQYDTAKRFISQAQDALKARNLVFAKNLADKAAVLAVQLGSR